MTPVSPKIRLLARVFSFISTPFYVPTTATVLLLMFSYLRQLPLGYKLAFTSVVMLFTWIFPLTLSNFYRALNGWTHHESTERERRFVPYLINILCYSSLYGLMRLFHLPTFLTTVIMSALILQIICALVNLWIRISTHAAASGSTLGMLMAFSFVFNFDATAWLCIGLLLSGAVCSSRLILQMHTYRELALGVFVGFVSGWCVVFAP